MSIGLSIRTDLVPGSFTVPNLRTISTVRFFNAKSTEADGGGTEPDGGGTGADFCESYTSNISP